MAGNVRVVLKSVFDDKGIKQAQSEFSRIGNSLLIRNELEIIDKKLERIFLERYKNIVCD